MKKILNKTIICVILSIMATILGVVCNFNDLIFDSYDGPHIYNLVATIIFIFVWVLFLFILIKTQHYKSIVYFCTFWILNFVGILLPVLLGPLEISLYPLALWILPAGAPFYGIKYIMDNAYYGYIAIALSFIMSAAGVLLLIHTKRSVKKILNKTIICVILSILATILGVVCNFNDLIFYSYDGPHIYNLVATIIFIFVWVLLLFILIKTKHYKSIVYFCVFWILNFVGILLRPLEIPLYPLALWILPAGVPFYGIRYILDNALGGYIGFAISLIMSVAGILLLIHTKRSVKKIENCR